MTNQTENTSLIHVDSGRNNTNTSKSKHRTIIISIVGSVLIIVFIVICLSLQGHSSSKNRRYPGESESTKQFAKIAEHEVMYNLNSLKTYASSGCEGTVLIVRHCEKLSLIDSSTYSQEHCNTIGFKRARFLATLFGNNIEDRWPIPSYLYALSSDRKYSTVLLEIETLQPLSDKIQVPIVSDYGPLDTTKLAHKLFHDVRKGEMCNKVTVVCWNQRDIPNLAQKLGCGPFNGCPMNYDAVGYDEAWQINFVYRPPRGTDDKITKDEEWEVFGSVVKEGFDPLHFTKIENNNEL